MAYHVYRLDLRCDHVSKNVLSSSLTECILSSFSVAFSLVSLLSAMIAVVRCPLFVESYRESRHRQLLKGEENCLAVFASKPRKVARAVAG